MEPSAVRSVRAVLEWGNVHMAQRGSFVSVISDSGEGGLALIMDHLESILAFIARGCRANCGESLGEP